jgi:hypothetical protein
MHTGHVLPFTSARPSQSAGSTGRDQLATDAVYLLFTSVDDTLAAIPAASELARTLRCPLRVIHMRQIPFTVPLESPCGVSPLETPLFKAQLDAADPEAESRVFLCRDAVAALDEALPRRSFVVLGGRPGWWPGSAERWRRSLEAAGHLVTVVDRRARQ